MPSRPVRIVTSGLSEPVREDNVGVSDPVRVVTDGRSDPVRVVTEGVSTPVRVVSGSLSTLASYILSLSPYIYFKLDETAGVAAVNSGTLGAAANGTYVGCTLGSEPAPGGGLAPSFDGLNDSVNCFTATFRNAFSAAAGTLSFWVKPAAVGVWEDGIPRMWVQITDATGNNKLQLYSYNDGKCWNEFGRGGTVAYIDCPHPVDANWLHVVNTWNKASDFYRNYHNTVLAGLERPATGIWGGALTKFNIGQQPYSSWKGYIAQLALWDRVLTPAEIAEIYNLGTP